jgi:hypothetical protein
MIFRKIVTVYSHNPVKYAGIELGKIKFMNTTTGDTRCINHGAL